jgi:hypothetical protein
MRIFIFLLFTILHPLALFAQFNFGIKGGAGVSFIQDYKAELNKVDYYNFDIEPYQYAYDVNAFVQYAYQRWQLRANIGYWEANFSTYSNVKPLDVDDGNWLTYAPGLYPVYFKTNRQFKYPYVGLGLQYRLSSKWNIGLGSNYLFSNKKYMTTPLEDFVTTPEALALGRTFSKKTVKGGNFEFRRRVATINCNINYQFAPRFSLLLEYQRNLKSVSTIHDYYFNIFNIGLSFNIRPTKPYQKDEVIFY